MANQLELRIVQRVDNILFGSGEKIIDAEHFISLLKQFLTEMRTEKTGTSGYGNSLI